MNRSFKIRLYPTKQQEKMIYNHIGACRFVWNYMMTKQNDAREKDGSYLTGYQMISLLTPLKNDGVHNWLYEISNKSLQITCKDLHRTFTSFFKKVGGRPKYKTRKHSKMAYPLDTEHVYFKDAKHMQIPKLGLVKYKTDIQFDFGAKAYHVSDARIKLINNKWILIISIECESQAYQLTDISMGIDLGVKELAVVEFDGEKIIFGNINKSKKMRELEKKKKFYQRRLARKYEANKTGNRYVKTNNILRDEEKLRKIWEKQSNIRDNYLHQVTHSFVSLLPRRIVMEDLNISGLMKNRYLSKAIQDQKLSTLVHHVRYKCEWYGIDFVQADRFYPSSKVCSSCGCIKSDLMLSDRVYICADCGLEIDRDYNAAINLSRYKT